MKRNIIVVVLRRSKMFLLCSFDSTHFVLSSRFTEVFDKDSPVSIASVLNGSVDPFACYDPRAKLFR